MATAFVSGYTLSEFILNSKNRPQESDFRLPTEGNGSMQPVAAALNQCSRGVTIILEIRKVA
jgi:hypothetical protein